MSKIHTYGYFLVAFVDILGQRAKLRELREIPTRSEDIEATLEILRDTAGAVFALRGAFQTFLRAYQQPAGILENLPPDKQALAGELNRCTVIQRAFSDTVILTVPLGNTDQHCTPMNGVHGALIGLCGVFLSFLAAGKPFRAGVDVGLAIQLDSDELYGPVLERAYSLESTVAQHPRLVVGETLCEYLSEIEGQTPTSLQGSLAAKAAAECKKVVLSNPDGTKELDYLGPAVHRIINGPIYTNTVREAYEFVVAECERWKRENNDKLASRFAKVRTYMESQLAQWDVDSC